jgi:hypothetical protein
MPSPPQASLPPHAAGILLSEVDAGGRDAACGPALVRSARVRHTAAITAFHFLALSLKRMRNFFSLAQSLKKFLFLALSMKRLVFSGSVLNKRSFMRKF